MSQDLVRDRAGIRNGISHAEAADRGIATAVKQIDGLHNTLRIVRDLHHQQHTNWADAPHHYCNECSQPWPCQTIQTLNDLEEAS
ncbi:hypothetical protein [Prescottella equi]|uniref:hypothetical protein n=1 Tax=Rhodococcus hoagii TaxID=43767 RepID=UPI001EEBCD68|nr:hypothetical protein [Prescottella equi]